MKNFLKKVTKKIKNSPKSSEPLDYSNREIIYIYSMLKREKLIPEDEPNYDLAKKVFLDFNDFNLNILDINALYLQFVPQSLLPYPKNYIKCAYYIYLESLKNEKKPELFRNVQEIGAELFYHYPSWEKYQDNLKNKAWIDDVVFVDSNPREKFKNLFGSYQISKKEYDSSPSSKNATDEKLIHDFGILPEIEDDVDFDAKQK